MGRESAVRWLDTEARSWQRTPAFRLPIAMGSAVRRLRLLSYNIQAGVDTGRYRDYLTHSWKHVLPYRSRFDNLDRIAELLRSYDVAGLQELDRGSLRSGFVDLTEYLARRGHFAFWYSQNTRNLGKIAQHSNGFLSRLRPTEVTEHRLPGLPGRGALMVRFGEGPERLALFTLHLALGRRARLRQLRFLTELVAEHPHVVLMGDLNCELGSPEMRWFLGETGLRGPLQDIPTFPSWRPQWHLDHILVSPTLNVERLQVLDFLFSDHLPIAMEVSLPFEVRLAA